MPRGVSPIDEARLQRRLWTPALAGTALWLDAADPSVITTTSGAVSQLRDKSGFGRHVSQSTGANRPGLATFNGLNALNLDGANDTLDSATSITSGTYAGPFNVFYAASRNNAAGGTILAERTTNLVASSSFFKAAAVNYISSDGLDAASNNTISDSTYDALASGGGIVSHQHVAGARDNLWLNGQSQPVIAGTASNITGAAGFRIGAREGTTGFRWSGLIGEVVVTLNTLTADDRQRIEGYLAWKWGLRNILVATHRYRNRPPLIGA